MRLDKIIYDIRESTKEHIDDSEIDDRYIIHLLNVKRAKYLRQELNNSQRTFDNTVVQTLTMSLELVSTDECNIGLSCNKILRTCKIVPDTLHLHSRDAVLRVSSVDRMSKPFNFVSRDRILYSNNSSFPGSIYTFLHDDGYIYINSKDSSVNLLECISITAIFEEPTELSNFSKCCNCEQNNIEKCFNITDEYPIQPHILDIIIEEIVLKILRNKQIPEDKVNDGNN